MKGGKRRDGGRGDQGRKGESEGAWKSRGREGKER